jgi:hypothetical protein
MVVLCVSAAAYQPGRIGSRYADSCFHARAESGSASAPRRNAPYAFIGAIAMIDLEDSARMSVFDDYVNVVPDTRTSRSALRDFMAFSSRAPSRPLHNALVPGKRLRSGVGVECGSPAWEFFDRRAEREIYESESLANISVCGVNSLGGICPSFQPTCLLGV